MLCEYSLLKESRIFQNGHMESDPLTNESPILEWGDVAESTVVTTADSYFTEGYPDAAHKPLGPGPFPGIRKPLQSLWWLIQVLLGVAFLLPLLAALAAIPGLNLLSLGMMIDAEASVGRTGRFRDGFPLLAISSRVGLIGLMVILALLPVFAAASMAEGQHIVAQASGLQLSSWKIGTVILQIVVFAMLLLAIANGGSFGSFFWPLRRPPTLRSGLCIGLATILILFTGAINPGIPFLLMILWMLKVTHRNYRILSTGLKSGEYVAAVNYWSGRFLEVFRPWHHLTVAIKAAVGALCWLVVPTLLLGYASSSPHQNQGAAVLITLAGGLLMIPVAAWLPLLQCHQAAEERFGAIFELRAARKIVARVPIRWAIATILMYGLAVPLYLSKVVLPPADAAWLFTPLFIIVIFPTRILMGWVYGNGIRKPRLARPIIRFPIKLFMIPLLGLYSGILFVLPLTSEAGPRAMLENHAFLLPVPSAATE